MEVKIYSIANCNYCEVLKKVLIEQNIPHEIIRVIRPGEQGDGISFTEYMEITKDIPLIQRCSFPQVYIDGTHTGDIKSTLRYLQNENK